MSQENVELARQYFEALNAHGALDFERTEHFRHPEIELQAPDEAGESSAGSSNGGSRDDAAAEEEPPRLPDDPGVEPEDEEASQRRFRLF